MYIMLNESKYEESFKRKKRELKEKDRTLVILIIIL